MIIPDILQLCTSIREHPRWPGAADSSLQAAPHLGIPTKTLATIPWFRRTTNRDRDGKQQSVLAANEAATSLQGILCSITFLVSVSMWLGPEAFTKEYKILQIIVTCACEETNPEVSKEYDVLRRMIDSEDNFLEVKALGDDLAMQVLKLVPCYPFFSPIFAFLFWFIKAVNATDLIYHTSPFVRKNL